MKRLLLAASVAALCLTSGCITQHAVHVEPVRLEPIHVTLDVNVRVQSEDAEAPAVPTTAGGDAPDP